ncbi:type IV pilus modification PilV family protein [Ephemeroptericola cinctiostellae]|nr:prepilin-type N-terminal cleavage/methylation domain-containing protein [Ephemeroptericola cinctiostellae]
MMKEKNNHLKDQKGFSLIEVLVATLIAAVAIGATMIIHANNLRQVSDTSELARAELVLVNMVSRMQVNNQELAANTYSGTWFAAAVTPPLCVGCTPAQIALLYDVPMWQSQAFEAGLIGARLRIAPVGAANAVWSVQMDWPAHAPANVVQRAPCVVVAANHCVSMLLRVGP